MAQETTNPSIVNKTITNVVNSALEFGARHVIFWEMFDNECIDGPDNPGCKAGRCHTTTPVTDPTKLHGWWLVKPDGSFSAPRQYLVKKIREGAPADGQFY